MGTESHFGRTAGAAAGSATPLAVVAQAFEELTRLLENGDRDLRVAPFTDACSLVAVFFDCLGFAFKFAEMEYVAKVTDLIEASKKFDTLSKILDHDLQRDTVRKQGSHSRSLRRVRLGLDLIKVLFEQFLSTSAPLKEAASLAYGQVFAPFHTWTVRKAVGAGMYTLPTREQLLEKLNETNQSAQKEMQRYIKASSPIIQHIDNLFLSRSISLDW